ncbi:MAG: hypothetical protein WD273_15240 [Trueperaceae bacterium]
MTPRAVEQVFLEPKGGGIEVLLVLEDEAGGRTREHLPLPLNDLKAAIRQVARQLTYRGIKPARKVRLRVGRGDELRDDGELLRLFLEELGR